MFAFIGQYPWTTFLYPQIFSPLPQLFSFIPVSSVQYAQHVHSLCACAAICEVTLSTDRWIVTCAFVIKLSFSLAISSLLFLFWWQIFFFWGRENETVSERELVSHRIKPGVDAGKQKQQHTAIFHDTFTQLYTLGGLLVFFFGPYHVRPTIPSKDE